MPRTSPSALTISVTTRPQPPWRFTSRRNAVSVMPAIGAMANGETRSTDPIFIKSQLSVWLHVRRVDVDRHRLADQVHAQHKARVRCVLSQPPADHAAQRPPDDLHPHPPVNHRARGI